LSIKCSVYPPSTSGPFTGTINADFDPIIEAEYADGYGCQCNDQFGTVTEEVVLSATAPEWLTVMQTSINIGSSAWQKPAGPLQPETPRSVMVKFLELLPKQVCLTQEL
jgi:hypothetical protein